MNLDNEESLCCPPFDTEKWNLRTLDWNDKLFIKRSVKCFFYIPINYKMVFRQIVNKIRRKEENHNPRICLSEVCSKWKINLYVEAQEEVEKEENIRFSCKILTKAYVGSCNNSYKEAKQWISDYRLFAQSKNFVVRKIFFWFPTCLKCAKIQKRRDVVIMGIVE